MNEQTSSATRKADELIELIIKSQPTLLSISSSTLSSKKGEDVGEFISGLRNQLIQMYNQPPQQ